MLVKAIQFLNKTYLLSSRLLDFGIPTCGCQSKEAPPPR